jgi:hypothetical protein
MADAEKIWLVQVFDSQESSIQAQGFRSQQGAITCLKDVKDQLDEQGGYEFERAGDGYAFNASCEKSDRMVQVDCFEVWIND